MPTFGGAKVAIWPEDLVAGNVDVAIIGVPSNMSSGRRDAGSGPDAMRALDTIATPDVQSLVKPLEALSVVDYGNFSIDILSTERTVNHVADMVAETAETGAIPMLVGGDTSMLYPGVKGVAQARGTSTRLDCCTSAPIPMPSASVTTRFLTARRFSCYWIKAL